MIEKSAIEHLLKPHDRSLWGTKYKVTPAFVEKVLGNGEKLLGVSPIDTRPDYYIIRVDSSWGISNWKASSEKVCDHLEEIYSAIEDQYGCGSTEDDDNSEAEIEFPALHCDSGCDWFDMTDEIALLQAPAEKSTKSLG